MEHHQADQHTYYTHFWWESQKGERGRGAERIFEEIRAENFSYLMRDMNINIQEVQQTPSKMNSKRPTPRHIVFKLSKTKDKERI